MPVPVHVQVLGPLLISQGGEPLTLPRKPSLLLGILAAHDHRTVSRRRLAEWLWPKSGTQSGLHSLSQCIYSIRRAGFDDIITPHPDSLRLDRRVTSDVQHFKMFLASGNLLRAAEQVRGGLLADGGAESDSLDEWMEHQRAQFLPSLLSLSQQLCEMSHFATALEIADVILAHDQWEQEAIEVTVRSLVGLERVEEAKAFAATKAEAWRVAFGTPPSLQVPTLDVAETTLKAPQPFVGRRLEMEILARAWSDAERGEFKSVFVVGEAGIGKTVIAKRLQRLVALRGGRTAWASGYVVEKNVPFGVLDQWLGGISTNSNGDSAEALSSISMAVPSGMPPELEPLEVGRRRIHSALAEHIVSAAMEKPVCLLLDDLHWADDASLALLHYLQRHHRTLPMLFVATSRPEVNPPLSASFAGAKTLHIPPLSLSETTALVEFKHGAQGESSPLVYTMPEIHRRTGGNPLLLTSLLADETFLTDVGDQLPSSVVEFLLPRMSKLSTTAKTALGALGILPDSTREILYQVVDRPVGECENALEELERSNLIDISGHVVRARHGLSSELALTLLPPTLESQLRGRTARVLQAEGRSSPAVLAAHYDVSGQTDRAYEAAVTAASAAIELYAHKEAEFFYKIALSNSPRGEDSARARLGLANLFLATGNKDSAARVLGGIDSEALEPSTALEVQVLKTIVALLGVHDSAALARGRALLDDLKDDTPADLSARLALAVASCAHTQGDLSSTLQHCTERTQELLAEVTNFRLRAGIAVRVGALVAMSESYERGLDQINATADEALQWPDTAAAFLAARGSAYVAAGRLIEAERDFLKAAELMERTGTYESVSMVANNLGVCYQEQGKFDEAERQYGLALEIRDRVDAPSWVQITYDNLGILSYERENFEQAIEIANAASRTNLPSRSFISHQSIKGLSCLELGRRIEARECEREIELGMKREEFWSNDVSYIEIFMARMAEIDGSPEAAVRRLSECISRYSKRDFFCTRRMEIELLRLTVDSNPLAALKRGAILRGELIQAGATSMVVRLDSVLARAEVLLS